MARTREIKTRIKSVSGTRKITKAMEMIASSKIRRAQGRILEARPFIDKIADFITDIACYSQVSDPLLTPHDSIDNVLVLGITADRGLCGGYNSSIIRLIENTLKGLESEGKKYELDIIGTRGKNHFRYIGINNNGDTSDRIQKFNPRITSSGEIIRDHRNFRWVYLRMDL